MDEIHLLSELQLQLNSITAETVDNTTDFICNSFFNEDNSFDFLTLISKYASIRPKNINNYVAIIKKLIDRKKDVLTPLSQTANPHFLYHLFKANVYSTEFIQKFPNPTNSMEIAFLSILHHDNKARQVLKQIPYSRFLSLKANNYQKYNEILENWYESETMGLAIKNDDVDLLKKVYEENQKLYFDEFSLIPIETRQISPLALSIFYQSKKCRAFLEEHEENDESCRKMMITVGELQNATEEQIKEYSFYSLFYHNDASFLMQFKLEESIQAINYKMFLKLLDNYKESTKSKEINSVIKKGLDDAISCAKSLNLTSFMLFLLNLENFDLINCYDKMGRKMVCEIQHINTEKQMVESSSNLERHQEYSHLARRETRKQLSKKQTFIAVTLISIAVILIAYLYVKYIIPSLTQSKRRHYMEMPMIT